MDAAHGIRTAIGVDLSGQHLTIVRCTRSRAQNECELLYNGPTPKDGTPVLPKELADSAERMNTLIATCMPVGQSFARWLHSPLKSVSKARKVLPSLLDIRLPFPIESCAYAFVDIRHNDEETVDAFAVAARREDIEKRLEALDEAGLSAEHIDHEGLSLWALSLRELPLEKGIVRVTCYLGAEHSTLVVGRGIPEKGNGDTTRGFVSAHSLRVGTKDFGQGQDGTDRAVSQFAARAQQVLRAHSADDTLQWVWTGPGADNDSCTTRLQQALHGVQEAHFLKHKDATPFLARAITDRALNPGATYCNLRQDDLAHPKTLRRSSRSYNRVAAAFLVAGLVLIVLAVAWQSLLATREAQVRSILGSATEALTGLPAKATKGQEVILVTRALEEEASGLAPFQAPFSIRLTEVIGRVLETAHSNDITIESLSVRGDSVSVRGAADDWDQCNIIAGILEEQGYDTQVERNDAAADERVHFAVRATRPEDEEDRS